VIHIVRNESDIEEMSRNWRAASGSESCDGVPSVLTVADLLALEVPSDQMLIEGIVPLRGASLMPGAPKSGKTLFAVQAAIAVASGTPFLNNYRVTQGPVMMIEQDDPAAKASVSTILKLSPIPVDGIPFFLVEKVPYAFGLELIAYLEREIRSRSLRLVVLDSYTALRGSRPKGIDIVKAEQQDLTQLDALAKSTNCAFVIVHHGSKGSVGFHWTQQAAGTFAMGAATESQIFISRFPELEGTATQRLVRIRGRHSEDLEMVLRFRKETLDYEHVLEGGASSSYPLILQIQSAFGRQAFSPQELTKATGVSRATAHRQLEILFRAGALTKHGYGEYVLGGVKL
jgi:AAA domain